MARQSRLPPFLLTRPAAQGDRFAVALKNRFGADIRIVCAPLLVPGFLRPELPLRRFRAVIFTSETGVRAFARLAAEPALAGVAEAWCVGDRTAQAARSVGLRAHSAQGDAGDLLAAILAAGQGGPLLHLRGRDVRVDLAERLNSAGIETFSAVGYAQESQALSDEARELLLSDGPVLLPLFSPRTAALFLSQARLVPIQAAVWVAALSPGVAEAVATLPPARLAVAARPDAPAMIEALAGLIAAAQHA